MKLGPSVSNSHKKSQSLSVIINHIKHICVSLSFPLPCLQLPFISLFQSVFHGDFLTMEITDTLQLAPDSIESYLRGLRSPIDSLPGGTFHVVVFSLLLEYFPAPYQRWICCQKAQRLLAVNGLLLVITPDSHHQNRNAPMMKSWKKAIEALGFKRWRYVKQEHLHCMAFRKILDDVSDKPVTLQQDAGPDMMYIPQDFHDDNTQGKELKAGSQFFFGSVPRSEEEEDFLRDSFSELPGGADEFTDLV